MGVHLFGVCPYNNAQRLKESFSIFKNTLTKQVKKKSGKKKKKKSRALFYCELLQVTLLTQDLRVFTKGVDSKNLQDIFTYDS